MSSNVLEGMEKTTQDQGHGIDSVPAYLGWGYS